MRLHCQKCDRSFRGIKGTAWCDQCKMDLIIEMRDEKKEKEKKANKAKEKEG